MKLAALIRQGVTRSPAPMVATVAVATAQANDAPSLPDLLAALNPPPDDRSDLEADTASQVATAEVLHLAAHPDRTGFALKNHADAIRHFRKMAADTERLAAMYRAKIDGHINAARKRLNPAEFDTWLKSLEH